MSLVSFIKADGLHFNLLETENSEGVGWEVEGSVSADLLIKRVGVVTVR